MSQNFSVEIRSRDRQRGTKDDYTVQIPQLPPNNYKATIRAFNPSLDPDAPDEILLQIRGAGMTRYVSTCSTMPGSTDYSPDAWVTFSCTDKIPAEGILYFDCAPTTLSFRWRKASNLTTPDLVEHQIQVHLEASPSDL